MPTDAPTSLGDPLPDHFIDLVLGHVLASFRPLDHHIARELRRVRRGQRLEGRGVDRQGIKLLSVSTLGIVGRDPSSGVDRHEASDLDRTAGRTVPVVPSPAPGLHLSRRHAQTPKPSAAARRRRSPTYPVRIPGA